MSSIFNPPEDIKKKTQKKELAFNILGLHAGTNAPQQTSHGHDPDVCLLQGPWQ